MPRVLKKAIGAAVVAQIDKADHVEEQPRPLAVGDAGIEQLDSLGRLIEDRANGLEQQFEPRDFRLPEVGDRLALLGALDARAPDRRP